MDAEDDHMLQMGPDCTFSENRKRAPWKYCRERHIAPSSEDRSQSLHRRWILLLFFRSRHETLASSPEATLLRQEGTEYLHHQHVTKSRQPQSTSSLPAQPQTPSVPPTRLVADPATNRLGKSSTDTLLCCPTRKKSQKHPLRTRNF